MPNLSNICYLTCRDFGQLPSSAKLAAYFADIAPSTKFLDCDRVKCDRADKG
ncbi:hypothetical protein FDUTEX481_03011 [Tolypothrix sp. PCC 7601]|nr:hypothetical protein [Tolypothrix sp. PCC 7601]EKF03905.1 hypothetical protein FDUTEX481_03011 [Tolypothrix sp. PCC 7601]UYD27989.1 hypothetical protein HGR01_08045 [Tolypothrix sp. PCC 7712]